MEERDQEQRDRETERDYITKWLMLKRKPPPQCSLQASEPAGIVAVANLLHPLENSVLASSNRQESIASNFFITKFSPNFNLKNTISSYTNWLSRWASHWHSVHQIFQPYILPKETYQCIYMVEVFSFCCTVKGCFGKVGELHSS